MYYIVAKHGIDDEGGIALIHFITATDQQKAEQTYDAWVKQQRQWPNQTVELYELASMDDVQFNLSEQFGIKTPAVGYYEYLQPVKSFATPDEDEFDYVEAVELEGDFAEGEELLDICVDLAGDYTADDFDNQSKQIARLKREYWASHSVELTLHELNGPGGGAAVCSLTGTKENLLRWITDFYDDGSGNPEEQLKYLLGEEEEEGGE